MKYFLHDTSAFDDEKVSELFINFGYEGLGLFYTTLEKMAKQEKPIKTDVLKKQLRIGKHLEKCWKFIENIGLISSLNGESFSEELLNFAGKYQIKKEKTREKVSEWRKNQEVTKNVTNYKNKCNHHKVNKSKVKEIDSISDRQKLFYSSLIPHLKTHPKKRIKAFYNYWSEFSTDQNLMRFELEKTWETEKRLNIWESREKKEFNHEQQELEIHKLIEDE